MRAAILTVVVLGLAACATTGPGQGGDKGAVMGAAARKQHGADPVAAPPPGVGEAEDPAGNGAMPTPR